MSGEQMNSDVPNDFSWGELREFSNSLIIYFRIIFINVLNISRFMQKSTWLID